MSQLAVYAEQRRVYVRGEEVNLTPKEFDLLTTLASKPGYAWSKIELLDLVWGEDMMQWQDATITEHMRRVRLKLNLDPAFPPYLQTIRGYGYRFERRTEPRWEFDQRGQTDT